MDNNPARRSSESSDDGNPYVLAPEPPDETDDEWYDAPLCEEQSSTSRVTESIKVTALQEEQCEDVKGVEEQREKIPLLQLREDDPSIANLVLETNLDTMQQKYTHPQKEIIPDVKVGNLETRLDTNEVCITFHALVPSYIDFQSGTDKVILRIWDGWRSDNILTDVEMQFICYRQEAIPAAHLKGFAVLSKDNHSLQLLSYKYYIQRSGIDLETNLPRQSNWELGFADKNTDRRILTCLFSNNSKMINSGKFYQYDGYIYEQLKKDGLIKTIAGYFKGNTKMENDAVAATKTFGRDIANILLGGKPSLSNITEVLIMSDCLRLCLECRYKIKDRKIKETLWNLYTTILQNLIVNEEELGKVRKMAFCLVMLMLPNFAELRSDDPAYELICKSFLMKVCPVKRIVVEWTYLQQILVTEDARKYVKDVLLTLAINICSDQTNGKNPTWMYLLPIIHFLDGACKPFQEVPMMFDHHAVIPKWWGITGGLENVSWCFKNQYKNWRMPLSGVITKLQYMFEVDFYLPRAMMASLRIEELKDALDCNAFPIEVECSTIYYFIKTVRPYDNRIQSLLEKCTDTLLAHTLTRRHESLGQVRIVICVKLSADLLRITVSRLENITLALNTAEVYLSFLERFDMQSETVEASKNISIDLTDICSMTINWMNIFEQNKRPSMYEVLLIWDRLIHPRGLQATAHVLEWTTILNKALTQKIKSGLQNNQRGQFERSLVEAYCSGIGTYSQGLQDLLSPFIFMTFEEQAVNENTTVYKKLWGVLSDRFFKEWNKKVTENGDLSLDTLVHWSSLPQYMSVLSHADFADDNYKQFQDIKFRIENEVHSFIKDLCQGTVSVEHLQFVKNSEVFLLLCKILDFETGEVQRGIREREEELSAFYRAKATIEAVKSFCENMEVQLNLEDAEEILQMNVEKSTLNELVVVQPLTDVRKEKNYVEINAKCLSIEIIDMIKQLDVLRKSGCFIAVWKHAFADLQNGTSITLNDMFERLYKPSLQRLSEKAEEISSGEITYTDMETFVGKICRNNYDTILLEINTVCPGIPLDICQQRIKQFEECRQISLAIDVASALLEVKKMYDLSGSFDVIEMIKHYDITTLALNSDKEDIMAKSKDLFTVTKDEMACLVAFAKSEELVSWIRDIMQGGMKELKVFVDLAMALAGDDAEKISRVQSLHVAVIGYAMLIFELKENSGWSDVLKACESVTEELNNTPKLPEKLEYACRYIHWFKEIKQAHSTVELTAFMQADNINECGVFKIGTQVWKACDEHESDSAISLTEISDIKKVLKLIVVVDESDRKNTEYTYDQLKDLQSRLMLVAGGEETRRDSVERFNSILDGVVRLCNIFLKLVKSGCMFFRNFAIELVCDPNRPVAASIIVGDEASILQCRKTVEEKLEDIVHKIAASMETCFAAWLEHVDAHRNEYPELNYFTTEQLVILQNEFYKLKQNQDPSKMIYLMLHDILQNCGLDDLKAAEVCKSTEKVLDETETESSNEVEEEVSQEETFVSDLIAAGYKKLVPFALKEFPDYNINDALLWCLDNEDNLDELEETQLAETTEGDFEEILNQLDTDIHSQNLISRMDDIDSQFDRCDNMLKKFSEIWKQFLESTDNDTSTFISLRSVGNILRKLAEKDNHVITRRLPKGYSESSPNLVVCKNEDIWHQTLSLYLYDDDQPLPSNDEVLVCSDDTTLEQVDIFLRRAFFNSKGKIHALVNADLMSFTLSEGIEHRLLRYQRTVQLEYRLVFICGSQSENRSVIISSLDKYRRAVFLMEQEELCLSLLHKLQIQQNDTSHAASVDFDRSTVRVVRSSRSGSGKTLYALRREEELQQLTQTNEKRKVSLPLHERIVDLSYVTSNFLKHFTEQEKDSATIFHLDITNEVLFGVDYLLFNLLILGSLVDKSGFVWRKMPTDLYLIETMDKQGLEHSIEKERDRSVLTLLPFVICRSPQECLDIYNEQYPDDYRKTDQLFDAKLYETELYQKPYECLRSIDKTLHKSSESHCIETMLRHCGVSDPSWSEIHHFVKFLSTQLDDFDTTDFVNEDIVDLPGFPMFVKRFLIQMSRDFSSRSLNLSEESYLETMDEENQSNDIHKYEMKRKWESSPHPYLFVNADRHSFTFLGFYINDFGDLVDLNSNEVLEERIIKRNLLLALMQNGVPIKEDFDSLHRNDKIERLCGVIGVDKCDDRMYDSTYELTTNNCKKMLAVYMRFRCGIPVIIMGETGCGKTRLITFLCEIMVPRDKDTQNPLTTNMIIMKVHGGVTNQDIKSKVWQAERKAIKNRKKYGENVFTILFFDEANTTESIGLIKEIMCDNSMEGKQLDICKNLKIVAACNPYRKHPEEVITKLEKAGLGYHVNAIKTKDRFGRIPMRRLVYRVQPLPQSLLPFVWDFGQLSTSIENLYIRHMVRRYMNNGTESDNRQLPNDEQMLEVISSILTQSQEYMRNLKDECSFVSLRDVDRVLQLMCWFYGMSKGRRTLFDLSDKKLKECGRDQQLSDETRSLLLALTVCYHSSLSNRSSYWEYISRFFRMPCELFGGYEAILEEIDRVQEVFLDSVSLEENSYIARNFALKENIFMMVICIELRIPLFLVGKPGSSKSLAKVIVTDAMQGRAAKTQMFKELKQVQMVSFQCSPLSSPEGIISTFRQCASFQQNYKDNLDTFVSVVVLDEIGLAEDSERMPLKTLHPLLEDGCQGDEVADHYKKVAFIGLSNWSLDPAKMNRGVFVQRQIPDALELENTARGICASSTHVNHMLIKPLSSGYLKVFERASEKKREFFGLRDFYSLMKMVNQIVLHSKQPTLPTYRKMRFAVRRNFSGLDNLDTFEIFYGELKCIDETEQKPGDPDDSFRGLLTSWLKNEYGESRHLLLLTASYSAINMFEQAFLTKSTVTPIIIFGSSFRRDQEYTQICRNINKIKICMETGKLVILVNSDNLYESLYDALNQYYVYFGGERYVDLGLGIHRVKCPVHKDFKLIVVAEKQSVYEKFPIPLINRLEKHCLTSTTLLNEYQGRMARYLQDWIEEITTQSLTLREIATEKDIAKVFIGYHHDVCATIALETWTDKMSFSDLDDWKNAFEKSKNILLWCAAPDAILRLTENRKEIQDIYWSKQSHESLKEYLSFQFKEQKKSKLCAQITTHSSLLTVAYKQTLREATGIHPNRILLLEALPSFDSEQQFISKIKMHIQNCTEKEPVLIIVQCDSGDRYTNLIACAKYAILDECTKITCKAQISIIFIVQLTPMENKIFHNIQCGEWHSAHIDNLYTPAIEMPSITDMQRNRMSVLISKSIEGRLTLSHEQETSEQDQIPAQCLDLRLLIDRSLQRAVSLIRDPEEHKNRSTKRVSLILPVLHEEKNKDNNGFVRGVSLLVQRIMADVENESPYISPDFWLVKEASSVLAIEKFGTLRRACIEAFDTRISPILGGVFSALDTDNNLDLLAHDDGTWQRHLFISLINSKEISEQLFRRIHTERGMQYDVQGTGYGGRLFQCKMPFSWIIHSMFEDILRQKNVYLQDASDEKKMFTELFEGMEVIKAIDSVPNKHFYDVFESYIYDFVQTVYPEEKGRQLVLMSIKQTTVTRLTENGSLSDAILLMHEVYKESASRFNYFRDISNVWCGCTDVLMASDITFDSSENNLTFLALRALIDNISPKNKEDIEQSFINGRDNWLELVQRFRQIVSQSLAFCEREMDGQKVVATERARWNRIVVMQLFMENKCFEDKLPLLWNLLGKCDASMKQLNTLTQIEKFLEVCFRKTKTALKRDMQKCAMCGRVMARKTDIKYCEKCEHHASDESASKEKTSTSKEVPYTVGSEKQGLALDKIRDYRRRCNAVLMDIVSQLCFADKSSPDSEVIEWLLSYSFQSEIDEDRQFLVESEKKDKDIGVDSNKVFKAFLFKHLLRSNEQEFKKHLTKFVESVTTDKPEHEQPDDVILSLIFSIEDNMLEMINVNEKHKIEIVGQHLRNASKLLTEKDNVINQIYGTSGARVALSICASYMNTLITGKGDNISDESDDIKSILQMAELLCKEKTLIWKHFLKHFSKEYGTDTLLTACKSSNPCLNWIKMDSCVKGTVDMYTACGEEYCNTKLHLLSSLIDIEERSKFITYIKAYQNKQTLSVMIELAVHREIELHHNLDGDQKTSEELELIQEVRTEFEGSCEKCPVLAIDEGVHSKYKLQVSREDTDRDISIKCVLFHWLCVIEYMNGSCSKLLKPLFKLAIQPWELKDVYFPCMPQDELADIRQQLVEEAQITFFGEETVYYKCENGHSYEIGDCGRPYVKAKCICGAEIGGKSHVLSSSNEIDDGSDRTQKGHCLGYAQDRHQGAVPERTLTPLQNALLKCLLHLSMYLGCGNSQDDISSMVPQETDAIHSFIWDHILADFEDLMNGMSLNIDEILLFVHSFLDNFLRLKIDDECLYSEEGRSEHMDHDDDESRSVTDYDDDEAMWFGYTGTDFHLESTPMSNEDIGVSETFEDDQTSQDDDTERLDESLKTNEEEPWRSKLGRSRWEENFARLFLSQFIEERTAILNEAKSHMEGSSTTGILALMNEKESNSDIPENKDKSQISDHSAVWVYRKPASIVHFKQAVLRHIQLNSSSERQIPVLTMFLDKINELQALRFVPNILKLQKMLILRYNKKIYQEEASTIKIKNLKEEAISDECPNKLIEDLKEAWNIARHSLQNYEFKVDRGRTALPLDMANMRFTDDTELAYLLPTMEGKGICTFALLDFLLRRHNELIETYISSLSGERKQVFTVVEPRDISAAHLITFHPEKDLLPIILANCSMSSSHIVNDEYDFKAIEKRVIDRFISTKSKVTFDERLEIDLMVYRSEMTNVCVLDLLHSKIPQERLDTPVKKALCSQIQDVPSIGHILSQLDTTINFLNITGGDPGDSLSEYMMGKLKLKRTELTSKIQQHCLLKHVKSLWMSLSFHRSYIMVRQGKPVEVIFENISSEYHETWPEDLSIDCREYAGILSKERLFQILDLLFEYIMLELTKRENKDDGDFFDKSHFRLMDCLGAFGDLNGLNVDVHDVPVTFLSIHSLHIWQHLAETYESRLNVDNKYDTEV